MVNNDDWSVDLRSPFTLSQSQRRSGLQRNSLHLFQNGHPFSPLRSHEFCWFSPVHHHNVSGISSNSSVSFILHASSPNSPSLLLFFFTRSLSLLQHLEFMVEAVHGAEVELPGLLVLVVQAVYGTETQWGGAVSLGGEGGWLAERAAHGGHGEGREGAPTRGQLSGHGREVRAAIQSTEVRRGAVALAISGGLTVAHGIGSGALHAGRAGATQWIGKGGQRGGTPHRNGCCACTGTRGHCLGWDSRHRGAGARVRCQLRGWGGLLFGGTGLGLTAGLLLLLAAFSTTVLKPHLKEIRAGLKTK